MLKDSVILIIGNRGLLGQELYRQSLEWTPKAVGWDKEEIDITDFLAVEEKVFDLQPRFIFNCAAYNDVDKAEGPGAADARLVNGEAVANLARVAKEVGAIFVHYSTDYVFKGDLAEGYQEDDAPEPISVYGQSKLLGEQAVRQTEGLRYYLLRTSRLFGPPASGKKSFVDKILEAAKTQKVVKAVDEVVGSPTYVKDLAVATLEMIERKRPWGIYHRTNSGACTWYGWAKKIFELAGVKGAELKPVPGSDFSFVARRPAHSLLLSSKLPPLRSWEDALEEYLSFKK